MSRLILVRHAAVELDPDRPAAEWQLTPAGRAAAEALAASRSWAGVALVAASPEPKAQDTAAPIAAAAGLLLRIENDLREVERPLWSTGSRAEYVSLVRRYLSGEKLEGWEPAEVAHERFTRCIGLLRAEGTAVAVTHGLVISLYLGLTIEQWEALPLPALVEAQA